MSVLEKIRSRAGLLVGIIGVALLVFILQSAFESGNFFFANSDRNVGEIAGKEIDYNTFNAKVQEAAENQKRNSGLSTLDQSAMDIIVQQVWNQAINEEVMNKEYAKLGISVSDEELYDLMVEHPHSALVRQLSDPKTNKIVDMFAEPSTGMISPSKIKAFTQAMSDEQEQQWAQMENYIRQVRTIEKYNNLIKKGLYVTTAEAKRAHTAQNRSSNIKYVKKNYQSVPDSTITVTDADIQAYYNAHQNNYKQEASRKIEYVSFDITASQEDMDEIKKDMERVASEFKKEKTITEDSLFVIAESDSRNFDLSFHTKGTLSPEIDTTMFKAEKGVVIGPYLENGVYKVSKLIGVKTSADSAKVRHILIAYQGSGASETVTRTKEQAKSMADSLLGLLKKGAKFKDFVEKFSDDSGKKMPPNKKEGESYPGKDGEYGWINPTTSFVESFKDGGLDGKKGDLKIVESNYGYHIMEVQDTKGAQQKVQVATIDKKIEPSSKTMQAVFVRASEFSGKNNTNDLFQKAVIEEKLNKRIADNIKESDKTVSGIESPRPLVKWVYENEQGTVSEPMEFGNKFIVVALTEVNEKGVAPLEKVKEDVTAKAIEKKKADIFSEEFNKNLTGSTQIDALATKMGLTVESAPNINFNTYSIPGTSNESAIIGAITALKAKTISKPLVGKEGVYVVYVESIEEGTAPKDYKEQQKTQLSTLQPRVDYEVYDALKTNANIVEHLVKFGF